VTVLAWMQDLPIRLVRAQALPVVGVVVRAFVWIVMGIDIPPVVRLGPGVQIMHRGVGIVVHRGTEVGARTVIYPGAVVGVRDVATPVEDTTRFVIGSHVVIGSGAKILGPKGGTLTIGDRAQIGANAVVLESVGAGEVWAGVPARRISGGDAIA
jgi:serine O-acetyltransferase